MAPEASRAGTRPVVLAHDYLTQRGGAERVALEIARALQVSEVYTSVYSPPTTFEGFAPFVVRETFLARFSVFRRDPRRALPLLARAWGSISPVDGGVVVCSSSGWSHSIRTSPGTAKIVYCHNPARWLYQPADYGRDQSLAIRLVLRFLAPALRRWDRRAAATAEVYFANSTSVARRIREAYGIEAEVLHPPVTIDRDGTQEAPAGIAPGYFLTVGRARGYKGTADLVAAFTLLPGERLVVVGEIDDETTPENVIATGRVSDEQLRWLYAHARALLSISQEDFGLTPVEANAFGTPALVLRAGGFLDSTIEGVSGCFIERADVPSIVTAVAAFPREWDREAVRATAERFAPERFAQRLRRAIDEVVARS